MAFKEVPIIRGFTEIKDIFLAAKEFGCHILGGYARYCCSPRKSGLAFPGDIDIYAENQTHFDQMGVWLEKNGFTPEHKSPMAWSFKAGAGSQHEYTPKVQLIKPMEQGRIVTEGSLEKILSNFDFSVIRIGLLNERTALADEDFIEDEKKKRLRIKNIHCPISSMVRCMKYARKGYFMRSAEAMKLFQDWDGRDEVYRGGVIDLLERLGDDPKKSKLTKKEKEELSWLLYVD